MEKYLANEDSKRKYERVERGEDFDVFNLFNGVAAQVEELSASPGSD